MKAFLFLSWFLETIILTLPTFRSSLTLNSPINANTLGLAQFLGFAADEDQFGNAVRFLSNVLGTFVRLYLQCQDLILSPPFDLLHSESQILFESTNSIWNGSLLGQGIFIWSGRESPSVKSQGAIYQIKHLLETLKNSCINLVQVYQMRLEEMDKTKWTDKEIFLLNRFIEGKI